MLFSWLLQEAVEGGISGGLRCTLMYRGSELFTRSSEGFRSRLNSPTPSVRFVVRFVAQLVAQHTLPSARQCLSCDACLEVKREDKQNCSVLCCVRQLCTMISTLRCVVQFSGLVFVTLDPFYCIFNLFVFICVYSVSYTHLTLPTNREV